MIYIEGHWETVNTLQDIVRVIREYYNEELADEMDELVEGLIDAYNDRIEQLQDEIDYYDSYDVDEYDDWEDA